MRCFGLVAVMALASLACRPYDGYTPIVAQDGLVPAAQFARYGREQAELIAIGRALAEWKGTADSAGYAQQTDRAGCFAQRFPEVATVTADPIGHRLTIRFRNGWRAAALPIADGVRPDATPGISPPGQSPCT